MGLVLGGIRGLVLVCWLFLDLFNVVFVEGLLDCYVFFGLFLGFATIYLILLEN